MLYLVNTPWWIKKWMYPDYLWSMPKKEKKIYLSFDDGPHPQATGFVLDELKKYNAKASFFCIGKNVAAHPDIYRRILLEGHAVGNHTYDHLNGWKTSDKLYFDSITKASSFIDTHLFRLGNRIGLAPGKTPLEVETQFLKVVPKAYLRHAHTWLILHGRYICKAQRPECWRCPLNDMCGFKPKTAARI